MGNKTKIEQEGIIDDLDLEDELDLDPEPDELDDDDTDSEPEEMDSEEEELEDELIVTIGDETPPKEEIEDVNAPSWVKDLRKAHKATQKENRELRDKLKSIETPVKKEVSVGPKPVLSDFDYDSELYDKELLLWHEKKRKADEVKASKETEKLEAEKAWKQKLDEYGSAKVKLKVKDFTDCEEVVLESFSDIQQGIVIQGADNPALVIYAIGKNSDKAKELSNIKDPVKFAFAIAKLEKDLKVSNRKAPPPEKRLAEGTGSKSGAVDSKLERLRADANKTGDYSKVTEYRRKQKK